MSFLQLRSPRIQNPLAVPDTVVSGDVTVSASVQSAAFSIAAVSVLLGSTLSPNVQAATFSTQTATVTGETRISPAVQSSVFSTQSPTVTGASNVSPGVRSAVFSIPAATIAAQSGAIISPQTQVLTASIQLVTLKYDFKVLASVLSATFAIQIPTRTGPFYSNKYTPRSTAFNTKFSSRGTSFNDKLSSRGTNYTDKYTSRNES